VLGIFVVSFYRDSSTVSDHSPRAGRPLLEIMRSPVIVLAIASSAVGYAVMSFVMTAGPISMHEHAGHNMQATKWVLQSHILAMYIPSLVYPWFYSKLGYRGMMWAGVVAYLVCLSIGFINTHLIHFWLTMVILGVGWNFLFLSGTNLLRFGYRDTERYKVQSFNDFLVFSIQAVASLSSGWFLYHWGWRGVLTASVPLVLLFALLAFASRAIEVRKFENA
jgi:MFS family permease